VSALIGSEVEQWMAAQMEISSTGRVQGILRTTPAEIRKTLPQDTAVLHFYVLPDRILSLLLWRGEPSLHSLPTTRVALDGAVRDALQAIEAQGQALLEMTSPQDRAAALELANLEVPRALGALADQLQLPIVLAGLPPSVKRLLIVPHDVLTNVPFAALPHDGALRLCERYSLSLLPSLGWLDVDRLQRPTTRPERPLVLGASHFPRSGYPPLSSVPAECESIAAILGARLVVDRADARESFGEMLEGVDWLHLATHGKFDLETPHESGIFLATRAGSNLCISIADLRRLDLRVLDTVVLSCCQVSTALVLPGQELVGVPSTLLSAGVGAVIAPLWRVDDRVSVVFMRELYESAIFTGALEGLNAAQRAWSQSKDPMKNAPYFWAAYTHLGC
jgi:CHAT domain-containing protein